MPSSRTIYIVLDKGKAERKGQSASPSSDPIWISLSPLHRHFSPDYADSVFLQNVDFCLQVYMGRNPEDKHEVLNY